MHVPYSLSSRNEQEQCIRLLSVLAISAGKKRYKTANLRKIRRHYQQDTLREQIIPDESNRFRYFYHIRRAHGDALSSVGFAFTCRERMSPIHLFDLIEQISGSNDTFLPMSVRD